jgi:hypothetical protein
VVVVIDEAQNLDDSVLEVVRMLSNFETPYKKLMHFVLAGQPQLAEKLASPCMLQFKQRISIVARLNPFSPQEVQLYIDHRLGIAGYSFARSMFTKQAFSLIVDASEGIPRNINNVCFNALSLGCVSRQKTIDADVIREVLDDLDLRRLFRQPVPAAVTPEPIAPPAVAARQNPIPQRVESNSDDRLQERHVSEPRAHEDTPPAPSLLATNHWIPATPSSRRLAFTFALVVALLGVFFFLWTRHHSTSVLLASTPTKVAASSAANPISSTPPPPDALPIVSPSQPKPMQPANASLVVVQPNQTLYRIIVDNLGQYNEANVNRIRALNPWLTNARRIRVGQTIRLRRDTGEPRNMPSLPTEGSQSHDSQQMGKGTE